MEEIGHTIYSGFWGLLCMVDTIYCGVGKEGEKGGSPGINICLKNKQKYY